MDPAWGVDFRVVNPLRRGAVLAVAALSASLACLQAPAVGASDPSETGAALVTVGGRDAGTFHEGNNEEASAQVGTTAVERRRSATSLGLWIRPSTLPQALRWHGSAVVGERLYVVGGELSPTGPSYSDMISFAKLSEGSVGGFIDAMPRLSSGRMDVAVAAYDGALYIVGGRGAGGAVLKQVVHARIERISGQIVSLADVTDLPVALEGHAAVAYRGHLYVSGGRSPTGLNARVFRAPIHATGALGAWTESVGPAVAWHGMAIHERMLYVAGGCNSLDALATCNGATGALGYARLGDDGAVGPFSSAGAPFPALLRAPLIATRGTLYRIGGVSLAKAAYDRVDFLELDRTLTSGRAGWAPLEVSLHGHSAASDGHSLYLTGGEAGPPPVVPGAAATSVAAGDGPRQPAPSGIAPAAAGNSVSAARVGIPGAIGAAVAHPAATPARLGAAGAAHNGFYYAAGGTDGTAHLTTVTFGRIRAPTATTTTVNLFTEGRHGASAVVHNGTLYVLGGRNSAGEFNQIYAAKLAADGSIAGVPPPSIGPPRSWATLSVHNDMLLVAGGKNTATLVANLEYARIHEDGTLGGMAVYAGGGPGPRYKHGAVVYGGYLYVLGGITADTTPLTYSGEVKRLALRADGTPDGSWVNQTPLPFPRAGFGTFALDGYLYVVGGEDGGGLRADVLRAPLLGSGAVGAWETVPEFALPERITEAAVAAVAGRMVVAFGRRGTTPAPSGNIHSAPLYSGGDLGQAATDGPVTARYQHASVIHGRRVFYIGGTTTAAINLVEASDVALDGTPSPVTGSPAWHLLADRSAHAAAVVGDRIYVFGGNSPTAGIGASIHSAQLDASSNIQGWRDTNTVMNPGRQHFWAAVHRNRVYLVAGQTPTGDTNTIDIATVDATGAVTLERDPQLVPVSELAKHCATIYNGYLYVVGGRRKDATGASFSTAAVYVARINDDGKLSAFIQTSSLRVARMAHACAVRDGQLYAFGGESTTNQLGRTLSDVEVAPILESGALGSWTPGEPLVAATPGGERRSGTALASDGLRIYLSGGYNDTLVRPLTDLTVIVPRGAPPRARYSRTVALGEPHDVSGLTLQGDSARRGAYVVRAQSAGADGIFGPWIGPTRLRPAELQPLSLPGVSFLRVEAILEDTGVVVSQADATGIPRNLTGLQISAIPTQLPPTALAVETQPPATATSGALLPPVRFKIVDSTGTVVTTAVHQLEVSLKAGPGSPAGTLEGTVRVAALGGIATFDALRITGSGTYALVARTLEINQLTPATTSDIRVTVPVGRLAFVQQPTAISAGAPFTPPVAVELQDASGNRLSVAAQVSLSFAAGPPGATFLGATRAAAVDGRAEFPGLSVAPAGTAYRLRAEASGVSVESASFDVASPPPPMSLVLAVEGDGSPRPGGRLTLLATVENKGSQSGRELVLAARAEGLTLREATLDGTVLERLSDENRWKLPELEAGARRAVRLTGTVTARSGEQVRAWVQLRTRVDTPASPEVETAVEAAPLTVELGGCGCASASALPMPLGVLLAALALRRRR